MSAIAHAFTEVNTAQTTTSTSFIDVPGASIASSNFTAGKKYLIYVTAQGQYSVANYSGVQVVHGSTTFNEFGIDIRPATTSEYMIFSSMAVWTAVGGEDVKVQFRAEVGGGTISIDQVAMFTMNLSDDVTENTDWFYAERTTDDTLSTTFLNGAAITFIPGTAGQNWLVLSFANVDQGTTVSTITRINRSGEASSLLPETRLESAASALMNHLLVRVFNLGAASNTFTEQSALTSGTVQLRRNSGIFALNMAKFAGASATYGAGPTSLSATAYATQLQSINVTPTVQGDVWVGAHWGFDRQNTTVEGAFRLQVDNVDQPAGQTTDAYQFDPGTDATDEGPMNLNSLVVNMTVATHTVELECSVDNTTGTPEGQDWTVWAIPMELANQVGNLAWITA